MSIKFLNKHFYINLSLVFFIFISDRLSKIYVINKSTKNSNDYILESNYLNIRLIWNEGVAFGLFSFDDKVLYHSLTLLISIIILVIFYMIITNSGLKKYSLILVIGGALGNFYDRIFFELFQIFFVFILIIFICL